MLRMISIRLMTIMPMVLLVACGGSDKKAPINKTLKGANDPGVRDQKFNKIVTAPCIDLPAFEASLVGMADSLTVYTSNLDLKMTAADKSTSLADDSIRAKILFMEQKAKTDEDEPTGTQIQDPQQSPLVSNFLIAVAQDQCTTVTFGKDDKTQIFKIEKGQKPGSLSMVADNKERRIYTAEGSGVAGTTRHLKIRIIQPVKLSCDNAADQNIFLDQTYIVSWVAEPLQLSRSYAELMVQDLKSAPRELKTLLAAGSAAPLPNTPPVPTRPIPGRPLPPPPVTSPSTQTLPTDMLAVSKELYGKVTRAIESASFPIPACKTTPL